MVRVTAAIVLATFMSVIAFDALCCPDGCTDRSEDHAVESPHGSETGTCLQCLGGLSAPVPVTLDRTAIRVTPVLPLSPLTPDTGVTHPLDQPPRSSSPL
jgi:hypothetical protein